MLFQQGCCSRDGIRQVRGQALGNEVEVVLRLRVAELADGIVWLGIVSGSEVAGIHLQPITPC